SLFVSGIPFNRIHYKTYNNPSWKAILIERTVKNMFKNMGGGLIIMALILTGCGSDDSDEVIPSHVDYNEDDFNQIVEPNNKLAFNLLTQVEPDDKQNLFISPTSLFMALSMVYNGADGETKAEIAEALKATGIEVENLNKANASLISKLHNHSAIDLDIANSIWVNDEFSLNKDFQQNTQDHFNAEVEEINITDSDSPKRINQWVEEATNNKITDIVDSPLDENLVAVLINAIYFNGDWKYEFDRALTETRPFHFNQDGRKNIPFMTLEKELKFMQNEQVQAIELPYNDEEMSMHIFLPKENYSLEELKEDLTYDKWEEWQSEFDETEGVLRLPKFKLDYEVILNKVLVDLGMNTAFDEEHANFSKMVQDEDLLWIDKVKQKSYIKVNEEGTEAAAATSVEMKTVSANLDAFQMVVDRPFFLTITDNETGVI